MYTKILLYSILCVVHCTLSEKLPEKPDFSAVPSRAVVNEGDSLDIHCNLPHEEIISIAVKVEDQTLIEGFLANGELVRVINAPKMPHLPHFNLQQKIFNFTITDISAKFNKGIKIQLTLDSGSILENIVYVLVTRPPKVSLRLLSTEETEYPYEGERLKLICSAMDGRPPAKILWFLGNKKLSNQIIKHRIYNLNNSYTIISRLNLTMTLELANQTFSCQVNHESFEKPAIHHITLPSKIKYAPKLITGNFSQIYDVELGSNALLSILFHAFPFNVDSDDLRWYINGKLIPYRNYMTIPKNKDKARAILLRPVEMKSCDICCCYNVSLLLLNVTKEGLKNTYGLKIKSYAPGTFYSNFTIRVRERKHEIQDNTYTMAYMIIGLILIVLLCAGIFCYCIRLAGRRHNQNKTIIEEDVYTPVQVMSFYAARSLVTANKKCNSDASDAPHLSGEIENEYDYAYGIMSKPPPLQRNE